MNGTARKILQARLLELQSQQREVGAEETRARGRWWQLQKEWADLTDQIRDLLNVLDPLDEPKN